MQLKGIVTFFAGALILISLYQLSFTWMVNSHEKKIQSQAVRYAKTNFGSSSQETIDSATEARYGELVDETKDKPVFNFIGIWKPSYQYALEQELNLGLDLQGGMAVTMEVGLDGLIRSMSNNPKDTSLNKALDVATQRKANSDADYVTLFSNAFKELYPNTRLAGLFAGASQSEIKVQSSDGEVIGVIRKEATEAIKRTYNILTTRIDQFGVAQPSINLDENKGIITVELAGIDDPERVRKYLQATANLEFWDTYVTSKPEFQQIIANIDNKVSDYEKSLKGIDTTSSGDSTKNQIDSLNNALNNQHPFTSLFGVADGQGVYPSLGTVGYVPLADTSKAMRYLALPSVRSVMPATLNFLWGAKPVLNKRGDKLLELFAIKKRPGTDEPKLSGEYITDARQDVNPTTNQVTVNMTMNPTGARIWETMTGQAYNDKSAIAIVLDDLVYSAPGVSNGAISGGNSEITGSFTVQEAQDLANVLKTGKLPAPAHIVQEQVVGPTLGQDAVMGGRNAFLISFGIIFLLMLVYYNTAGWVANIALILNLLFTIGILSSLHATLTAPGIAGLVLTIGMAVDTNVIIFERIKEELARGSSYPVAVVEGYKRSYAPVLDAQITTLLTAIILFYFGLGPVLGFATTQIIGIILSLFCGILVSRLVTDFYTNKKRHFSYFTGVSKRIFKHAKFKFIEYRKVAYIISGFVLIMGIGSLFNGFDQGVEFKGGRSYTVQFDNNANFKIQDLRKTLEATFSKMPVIKTVGTGNQYNITTDYLINQPGQGVDSMVEYKLYEGLKPYLPQGLTYDSFDKNYKLGSSTVLPTISDDLKKGAIWATIIALITICLYIFMRFRDWRYSLGTIIALMHDVFVTLAVFSFFRGVVPFPLEIDQHFIAAVLTVIGFSMNDTVIVFDRIREYSRKMHSSDKGTIINSAVNDTLSRTVMTSLTVFLTLLILFIFGGEVTRGFAFAMLIGVITGTYSSIFVAAPILIDFAKSKPLGQPEHDKTLAKARHSIG